MKTIVLDANVAVDWFYPSDEGDAYSLQLRNLASQDEVEFKTPLHFDVEVARTLRLHYKHNPRRFTRQWFELSLEVLDTMPIQSIAQGVNFAMLGALSRSFNLDVPDVPYLYLALTMDLPIATRDRGIISACKVWNVEHWTPAFTAV